MAGTANSLTQVLESICRERRRENLDKVSEDGFVVLAIESFWTRLFSHYFIQVNDETRDDLLFYVKSKNPKDGGGIDLSKNEPSIAVFRRDSKVLPSLGDPCIEWEETVCLNLILQQFEYTLTCAVCTKPQEKELRIIQKVSQPVYATPNRRRMDSKGETTEISYPNIFFILDNFEEIFKDFALQENEMVCVELVARDKADSIQGVIFLGSIRFEALKRVYNGRSSVASKVAQKVSMGWWRGPASVEFIKMKGPAGKGHAEMAICQQKSGVEHRTSCGDDVPPDHFNPCTDCSATDLSCRDSDNHGMVDGFYWLSDKEKTRRSELSKKKKGASTQWMKFRRRSLSGLALSAYLTYVTLPWSQIMKDILDVRQQPILA